MSGTRDFWDGVTTFGGATATRCDWENASGGDLNALTKRYLVGSGAPAQYASCPQKCGCTHRLGPLAGKRLRYLCDCDDQTCPEFTLSPNESEGVSLDGGGFLAALADCLGVVRGKNALGKQRRTIELGHVVANETAWAVWLCLPGGDEELIDCVRSLVEATTQRPFAVLAPEYEVSAGSLLERNSGRLFALRAHVTIGHEGGLCADEKLLDRIGRVGVGGAALRPKAPALNLRGKRYELVDGFTGLVDHKKKQRTPIATLRCQAALRVLVQNGAGSQGTAMHKKEFCDSVYREFPGAKSRPQDDKPIQFFRYRRENRTVQMPLYKAIVRSDEHGMYWLEL